MSAQPHRGEASWFAARLPLLLPQSSRRALTAPAAAIAIAARASNR